MPRRLLPLADADVSVIAADTAPAFVSLPFSRCFFTVIAARFSFADCAAFFAFAFQLLPCFFAIAIIFRCRHFSLIFRLYILPDFNAISLRQPLFSLIFMPFHFDATCYAAIVFRHYCHYYCAISAVIFAIFFRRFACFRFSLSAAALASAPSFLSSLIFFFDDFIRQPSSPMPSFPADSQIASPPRFDMFHFHASRLRSCAFAGAARRCHAIRHATTLSMPPLSLFAAAGQIRRFSMPPFSLLFTLATHFTPLMRLLAVISMACFRYACRCRRRLSFVGVSRRDYFPPYFAAFLPDVAALRR
jgi:hypothetical protein